MRRTARVLSVAVLATAALGAAGPAALADPAAQVGPSSVSPGGSVTVSVTCDAVGGAAPETLDVTSQAFDEGTVRLQKVPGNDDGTAGPAYRGTARIASAADLADGGPDAVTADSAWTADGTCPAEPGGRGKAFSATFQVAGDGGRTCGEPDGDDCGAEAVAGDAGRPCGEPASENCNGGTAVKDGGEEAVEGGGDEMLKGGGEETVQREGEGAAQREGGAAVQREGGAAVQRGVRAGSGGSFGDCVPALVAGGVLIAGALGAAAHRLRHRHSTTGR
ncbi:hypothetical protein ACYF6T_09160 [Streptomyces sp. 7R007]